MAKITQKQTDIDFPGIKINLYSDYSDNMLISIKIILAIGLEEISGRDNNGVLIWDGKKLSNFYTSLILCLNYEVASELKKQVTTIIRTK